MKNLQYSDIIKIHKQIISKFKGENGILNEEYINAALNSWKYSFDGELLYKTVLEQCVKVAYELIRQHPFIDGNKRVGIISLLALLEQNNINVKLSNKDLIGIGYAVASGRMDYDEVVNKIKKHLRESIQMKEAEEEKNHLVEWIPNVPTYPIRYYYDKFGGFTFFRIDDYEKIKSKAVFFTKEDAWKKAREIRDDWDGWVTAYEYEEPVPEFK